MKAYSAMLRTSLANRLTMPTLVDMVAPPPPRSVRRAILPQAPAQVSTIHDEHPLQSRSMMDALWALVDRVDQDERALRSMPSWIFEVPVSDTRS